MTIVHSIIGFKREELPKSASLAEAFIQKKIEDLFILSEKSGGDEILDFGLVQGGNFGELREFHLKAKVVPMPHAPNGLPMSTAYDGSIIEEI